MRAQAAFDACSVDIQLKLNDRPSSTEPDNAKRRKHEHPREQEDRSNNHS